MSLSAANHEVIRDDILQTARRRFQHFGYTKTTLSEIAADVNMSAGNLYRYFVSKQAIALACGLQILDERMEQLNSIIQKSELTAVERLMTYAISLLSHSKEIFSDPTNNNELADLMAIGCQELVTRKLEEQLKVLRTILSHGNETGEFKIHDVDTTAKSIQTALLALDAPSFVPLFSDTEWRQRVTGLVNLLIFPLEINRS